MGILDRAELLLRAERYSGSGDWLDESGNGHDAQLGSGSGSDTNDPLFKPYDGTQYLYLPGSSGNYASTADVNLVDADTAHMHQSMGEWINGPGASANTQSTDLTPHFGDFHGEGTCDGGSVNVISMAAETFPVSASTQYTVGIRMSSDTADRFGTIVVNEYDSGGSSTQTTTSSVNGEALTQNEWTLIDNTFTTHANTVSLRMILRLVKSGNAIADVGDKIYWDAVCLRTGSDASFVPSLRIVGDLELEAKVALDDYTPAATNTILDCLNSNDGYRLRHTTGDLIEIAYGNGSSTRAQTSTATGLTDGEAHVIKVTIDQSTGAVVYYIDGVQHDTDTMTTGAGKPSINDLVVGANAAASANWTDGDIYYVIVRDGISGPVVAEYRASDASEPFATHTGAQDGRTWTHNRSASGYVSTVVDRDMFLLSTDDYFLVADDDALNFTDADDFSVIALYRSNGNMPAGGRLVWKRSTNGYGLNVAGLPGDNRIQMLLDGSTGSQTLQDFSNAWDEADVELRYAAGVVNAGGNGVVYDNNATGTATAITASGTYADSYDMRIGGTAGAYTESQIIAIALFREALTDNEIYLAGRSLIKQVDDPQDLHGDALKTWIIENDSNWTSSMSLELVGLLNDLNGTSGKEYAEARATYLSVEPAG